MIIAKLMIAMLLSLSVPTEQTVPKVNEPHKEYVGTYTISAYSYYECGSDMTASGNRATAYKTIATSDKYPFGTVLEIEGVGRCVVEDRGGAYIQSGERIDLYVGENRDEAIKFGLQERKVYIIK